MPPDKNAEKTESEALFERFCTEHGIGFKIISTGLGRQPDYELAVNDRVVIAEITQLDANETDSQYNRDLKEKGAATSGGIIGSRIREKIGAKMPQLKAPTHGNVPCILVVMDNTMCPPILGYTKPVQIRAGMYGFDAVKFGVPQNMAEKATVKGLGFGGGRKVTENSNTTLSAIVVLEVDSGGHPRLVVYHNIYAKCPLPPDLLRMADVRQFTLQKRVPGQFQDWSEL